MVLQRIIDTEQNWSAMLVMACLDEEVIDILKLLKDIFDVLRRAFRDKLAARRVDILQWILMKDSSIVLIPFTSLEMVHCDYHIVVRSNDLADLLFAEVLLSLPLKNDRSKWHDCIPTIQLVDVLEVMVSWLCKCCSAAKCSWPKLKAASKQINDLVFLQQLDNFIDKLFFRLEYSKPWNFVVITILDY